MEIDRDELRRWLRAVLMHQGWSGAELAKRIGTAASTINKFLNDPDATHTPKPKTLRAIQDVTGFAPFDFPGPMKAAGFREPDASPYFDGPASVDDDVERAVRLLCQEHQAKDPWVLRSRALDAIGFLPGDILLVDLSERARPRDIVCAQVYDWAAGRAETVFRLFDPPYLLAVSAATDTLKPFVVDEDRVVIKGVVTQMLRPRRGVVPKAA